MNNILLKGQHFITAGGKVVVTIPDLVTIEDMAAGVDACGGCVFNKKDDINDEGKARCIRDEHIHGMGKQCCDTIFVEVTDGGN